MRKQDEQIDAWVTDSGWTEVDDEGAMRTLFVRLIPKQPNAIDVDEIKGWYPSNVLVDLKDDEVIGINVVLVRNNESSEKQSP